MKLMFRGKDMPSKRQIMRESAIAILSQCKSGEIARDSPEVKRASSFLGAIMASRILDNSLVTCKAKHSRGGSRDAMLRRLPGCFEQSKR